MGKFAFVLVTMLVSQISLAGGMPPVQVIAPQWKTLRKMDAIAVLLSSGDKKTALPKRKVEDLVLHSIVISVDTKGKETATADTDEVHCTLKINTILPPAGISGAASYQAKVVNCGKAVSTVVRDVLKYEKIREKLNEAAMNAKVNMNFHVRKVKGNEEVVFDTK